jgi:hypothetical protein
MRGRAGGAALAGGDNGSVIAVGRTVLREPFSRRARLELLWSVIGVLTGAAGFAVIAVSLFPGNRGLGGSGRADPHAAGRGVGGDRRGANHRRVVPASGCPPAGARGSLRRLRFERVRASSARWARG